MILSANMEAFHQIIRFIQETDKLKTVIRETSPIGEARRENDAEHSWQLALMAVLLKDYANAPVDINKVVKMLLIHDLVEIYVGDVFYFDAKRDDNQAEKEKAAAEKLYGLLPEPVGKELYDLWYEFEFEDTAEKRFARAVDRYAPTLMNRYNQGGTWTKYQVPYEKLIEKLSPIKNGSQMLWEETQTYIEHSLEQGWIQKSE